MHDQQGRQRIAQEFFAATGKRLPEDDPIIEVGLFYSQTMRAAGDDVAGKVIAATAAAISAARQTAEDGRAAAVEAARLAHQTAATQKAMADAIEARFKKQIREAVRGYANPGSPPRGWRGALAWVALGIFIAAGAMSVACGFSFSWVDNARLGAEFKRIIPTLDPSLRDKLIAHLEKHRG